MAGQWYSLSWLDKRCREENPSNQSLAVNAAAQSMECSRLLAIGSWLSHKSLAPITYSLNLYSSAAKTLIG